MSNSFPSYCTKPFGETVTDGDSGMILRECTWCGTAPLCKGGTSPGPESSTDSYIWQSVGSTNAYPDIGMDNVIGTGDLTTHAMYWNNSNDAKIANTDNFGAVCFFGTKQKWCRYV